MKSITRFTNNLRGNKCLNCENDISEDDNFCSRCGQVNDLKKVSLNQYLSAYFDDFLSFDSRFLNTIVALIFKPGHVTKNYVAGKRMSYVNPFKLYLHITILFFLVLSIFSTIDKYKSIDGPSSELIPKIDLNESKVSLDSLKSETLKELKKNDVQLDSSTLSLIDSQLTNISVNKDSIENKINEQSGQKTLLLYTFIDSIVSDSVILNTFKNDSIPLSEKDSTMIEILGLISNKATLLTDNNEHIDVDGAPALSLLWEEISIKGKLEKKGVKHLDSIFDSREMNYEIPLKLVYNSGKNKNELNKIQTFIDYQKDYPDSNSAESLKKLGFEKSYWNFYLFSKSKEWGDAFGDEHYWEEFIDRILSRISVALFFLLPIFTLIVSLLYIRRKYNYTENLVFVFHVQTVFFLLLLIFMLVNRIVESNLGTVLFLLTFMIYLYLAMRKFYGQGWFKTFVKYIMLNTAFMFLALIGGLIISFLAFLI